MNLLYDVLPGEVVDWEPEPEQDDWKDEDAMTTGIRPVRLNLPRPDGGISRGARHATLDDVRTLCRTSLLVYGLPDPPHASVHYPEGCIRPAKGIDCGTCAAEAHRLAAHAKTPTTHEPGSTSVASA